MMKYLRVMLAAAIVGLALSGKAETVYTLVSYNMGLGGAGMTTVSGDFDGDAKIDPAVYQEATGDWYVGLSSNSYAVQTVNLGGPGYTAVAGDFDGDAKTDPTVYQAATGNWYARLSASSYAVSFLPNFGEPGYLPVPGDYDGNGETEMAVYQPSSGDWHLLRGETVEVTDMNVLAIMYSNAMVNASNVVASKIRQDLTSITPDNADLVWRTNPTNNAREVLVISFMTSSTASNYYRVGQYASLRRDSWVTLAPELKGVCQNYTGTNLLLRLKQVLGLPATSGNDTVVEMYVNPLYLLRPSRDPEITDRESEVAFRTNTAFAGTVTTNYTGWFQRAIDSRNYGMTNGVWNAYPWTQLGYTYDWSKTGNNVMGLSEFVIPGEMLYSDFGLSVAAFVVTATNALDYAAAPDNRALLPVSSEITIVPPDDR